MKHTRTGAPLCTPYENRFKKIRDDTKTKSDHNSTVLVSGDFWMTSKKLKS